MRAKMVDILDLRSVLVLMLYMKSKSGCVGEATSAPVEGLASVDHRAAERSEPWHTSISPSYPGGLPFPPAIFICTLLSSTACHMSIWNCGQVDPVFEGISGGTSSLVKYNPLSNVSSAEVWNFLRVMVRPCRPQHCTLLLLREFIWGPHVDLGRAALPFHVVTHVICLQGVPTNDLHACGYISIGCEPCTRPVLPNQHEREGRWWWEVRTCDQLEVACAMLGTWSPVCPAAVMSIVSDVGAVGMQDATGKECGLHSGNIVQSTVDQAHSEAVRDLWDTDANVPKLSKEQLAGLLQGPREKHTLVVLYAPWCQYSQARVRSSGLPEALLGIVSGIERCRGPGSCGGGCYGQSEHGRD